MPEDRVSVSIGRTISANYNSVRVDVGMSSDVGKGETSEEAFTRVERKCASRLQKITEKMQDKLDY